MPIISTCIAPVNIAVIKYWGKRDEKLILPLNDSISTTLSTRQMRAKTSVMRSPDFTHDMLWLNGQEESFDNPRLMMCLSEIRRRAQAVKPCPENEWKVHICSENNFPTAAGLASSAAGYACLVFALARLFGVEGDVSGIARLGSGSACRSLYGGIVQWERGNSPDGQDSVARQLFTTAHWPSLRILILVVAEKKKKVSSTGGMRQSVETSDLLKYRVTECVPKRVAQITKAIADKDFKTFAEITMKDSNQFHAIALDTFPPIAYMNDTSHAITSMVHAYNDFCKATKVAYTFDAGPNACLYAEAEDMPQVAALVLHMFPPSAGGRPYFLGLPLDPSFPQGVDPVLPQEARAHFSPHEPGLLQHCILTEIGDGPTELTDPNSHLLGPDGLPNLH